MDKNYTHISLLLDRSGSMESIKEDVVGGIKTFLEEQKLFQEKMTITFATFADDYTIVNNFVPISEMKFDGSTYFPSGGTALLKSATKLIKDTGTSLKEMNVEDRPNKVLILMITDGGENSSNDSWNNVPSGAEGVTYTNEALKELVKHQTEKYNWEFKYIGANQDGFATGAAMGMRGMSYETSNAMNMFSGLSKSVVNYRQSSTNSFNFSEEDVENSK